MKIDKYIVRTELGNTDENQAKGNSAFDTQDYVFFETYGEVEDLSDDERVAYPSDYAVMNGALLIGEYSGPKKDRQPTWHWLRSAYSKSSVFSVKTDGSLYSIYAYEESAGLCPALHLNLASVISARSAPEHFKIEPFKDKSGKILYHTIEFGSYPQDKAKEAKELEKLYNAHKLTPTGKTYTGYMKEDGSFQQNQEFEYNGKKYVRVISKKHDDDSEYKDKTKAPENGTPMWAEVQPIKWKIKNYDELPRSINPNGKGTAKTIYVKSEEGIMSGIPFYPKYGETEHTMWQNSPLRAIFNGYDLHEELSKVNGNKRYIADNNYRFKGKGFLQEAFGNLELTLTNSNVEPVEKVSNPYNLYFEELSNDELLNYYISSNTSVFLHGASGVGKSARVKALDPTATRITLRPQMNPEEIDGTLDRATGKYIPPLWYTQLCEKCEREPNRKHVLFIDELTNVKSTVQSLVYSIVLDRAGKDGLWPLPDNAVVVAAGNETEGNQAAYPMTNALFRRFCHIYYEVDKTSWLDWATGIQKPPKPLTIDESEERARIHPAILAFMMSRGDEILNQELDEENPNIVTDPRKWEIASNILYATKNPNALRGAIGEVLTADFANFVKAIPISVEDVISGHYDPKIFANMQIDQKLSTVLGLCNATENDLPQVRRFIGENLGKESLANFDILWIRGNSERAEVIKDIREEKTDQKYQ